MSARSTIDSGGAAPAPALEDRLLRFLHRELASGREGLEASHALPIEERVDRGVCLRGLRSLGWDRANRRLTLACRDNLSRFRAGDKLSLGYGDDPGAGLAVIYQGYDPVAGTLALEKDPWAREDWRWIDLARPLALDQVPSDHIRIAIDAVQMVFSQSDARSRRIGSILDRTARVEVSGSDLQAARARAASAGLDRSQAEAYAAACAARPFHLIQGPPGSGKTHVIAALVGAWAAAGERVLVTAQTHRAVNNVLAQLVAAGVRVPVVKIGDRHHAEDLPPGVERIASLSRLSLDVSGASGASVRPTSTPPAQGMVVGATVFALRKSWTNAPFTSVVFDEAAQILLPLAICGLLAGERYLFVGDHRQLGPIVAGEHDDPIAGLSIFEHLAEEPRYAPSLLKTTYRMNGALTEFPSRAFYGGALESAAGVCTRRFELEPGGPLDALLDPDTPAVIATIAHEGHRTRSLPEARLAADLVDDLVNRQRIAPSEIAVLTPYRAQIRAIRNALARRSQVAADEARGLVIDTVERMQGQEREIVIVSLVCSEPEHAAREAAFFFSPNRLNVMLTRARTKLVIIASPHLFEALPGDLAGLKSASLFARLYRELPKIDLSAVYCEESP